MRHSLRVLTAAVAVVAATFLLITLITTGFAFKLAFQARRAPDPARIGQFAQQVATIVWTPSLAALAIPAAFLAARAARSRDVFIGLEVGALAAILGCAPWFRATPRGIIDVLVITAAGTLGGILARRGR
jgi:hypothetical protein